MSNVMKNTDEDKRLYCTFRLADRLHGINILDVKEIKANTTFTPVFHAPKEIKGYVNIRGHIYLILDLPVLMKHENTAGNTGKHLIIFKQSVSDSLGIVVDNIGDVVEINTADIEERRKRGNASGQSVDNERRRSPDFSVGVCKLKEELMIVIEPRNFLNSMSALV